MGLVCWRAGWVGGGDLVSTGKRMTGDEEALRRSYMFRCREVLGIRVVGINFIISCLLGC